MTLKSWLTKTRTRRTDAFAGQGFRPLGCLTTVHWPLSVETIENSIGTDWLTGAEKSNSSEDSDFESG
jgi:hypothetical protein